MKSWEHIVSGKTRAIAVLGDHVSQAERIFFMSLIRWGEYESNVYVIGIDDSDHPWECVSCKDGYALTKDQLKEHLLKHRANGDVVPDLVFERLESGDW